MAGLEKMSIDVGFVTCLSLYPRPLRNTWGSVSKQTLQQDWLLPLEAVRHPMKALSKKEGYLSDEDEENTIYNRIIIGLNSIIWLENLFNKRWHQFHVALLHPHDMVIHCIHHYHLIIFTPWSSTLFSRHTRQRFDIEYQTTMWLQQLIWRWISDTTR